MRSHFGSLASPADAMSEGSKLKPPSLGEDTHDNTDTDHRSALYQLQILTEFMAKEFLDLKPEKICIPTGGSAF